MDDDTVRSRITLCRLPSPPMYLCSLAAPRPDMLRPNPRQRVLPNVGPGDFGAYGAGRIDSRKEAGRDGSLRVLCETGAAVDVTALSAELDALGRVHPELAGQLTLAATTIDEQKEELGGMLGEMAKVKAWGSRPPWSSRPWTCGWPAA